MNSRPHFSVIIPTYQRNDLLAKCLDCLAPGVQTLSSEQYEVIVTDDGSEITAEAMIREKYPWAKSVPGPRRGPAANRNNGASYAQGEWLVFTDDDCLPDSHWLEAYARATIAEPNYLVFEGRTYVERPRVSLAETAPSNESGGYLWSCNLAVQRKFFEFLSGFDERFPYAAMEDIDFHLRIQKTEQRISFIRDASVCHPWRLKEGWRSAQRYRESIFIYLSIHPSELNTINFLYYLRLFVKNLKIISWGLIKYKGKGIKESLIDCATFLKMAFLLFNKSY